MTYSILYSKEALKVLKRIDKENKRRIISTLERIRIRPYSHIKKLVGNPYFRLKVGKHRIILDILDDQIVIFVLKIGHRKNVYR